MQMTAVGADDAVTPLAIVLTLGLPACIRSAPTRFESVFLQRWRR